MQVSVRAVGLCVDIFDVVDERHEKLLDIEFARTLFDDFAKHDIVLEDGKRAVVADVAAFLGLNPITEKARVLGLYAVAVDVLGYDSAMFIGDFVQAVIESFWKRLAHRIRINESKLVADVNFIALEVF
jgi:hypothetical protein